MSPKSSLPDPAPFPLSSKIDPWIQTNLVENIFDGNLTLLQDAVNAATAHEPHQRPDPETGKLKPHRSYNSPYAQAKQKAGDGENSTLSMPDEAGYQFLQARGCVIIKNPLLGYVAVLPIGMAQVSSVNLVWQPGPGQQYPIQPNVNINKGDEISHFEFGGSDIILVFQQDAQVHILGAQGQAADGTPTSKQKYLVGMPLGYSTKGLVPSSNGHRNGVSNGH
ncbi:phosphatidylserine decarboxylase [Colletotrichum scovillei]|uniref:Phosphatidylserine decarboxylase n=1 Tax=Colletotrichum scovillei TaxID=1209932 RepID=A0A9P7UI97_9PEZI|nr:phosphatidylserine decarboxylase [Colletotrichum scovillei]KAG7080907.1 phosphatidylserine decarboxylase [Colletotrichum scovillei]